MIILASLVFMTLLVNVYLIREIKKFKKKVKENDKSLKEAFKQISGLLTSSGRTLKLFQRFQESVTKETSNIVHDINDLYNFSVKQTKTIKSMMEKHNEFVNEVMDDIRDLHCELNDFDCSDCEYHDFCISDRNEEESTSFSDLKDEDEPEIVEENGGPIICRGENRMIIDPSAKGAFNKLEKAMSKSGVPKEVIDNYVSYIKKACSSMVLTNKVIEVVWIFGNSSEAGVIKHKFTKKEDDVDKLVNPNAKIVKTLNNLYNHKTP